MWTLHWGKSLCANLNNLHKYLHLCSRFSAPHTGTHWRSNSVVSYFSTHLSLNEHLTENVVVLLCLSSCSIYTLCKQNRQGLRWMPVVFLLLVFLWIKTTFLINPAVSCPSWPSLHAKRTRADNSQYKFLQVSSHALDRAPFFLFTAIKRCSTEATGGWQPVDRWSCLSAIICLCSI